MDGNLDSIWDIGIRRIIPNVLYFTPKITT